MYGLKRHTYRGFLWHWGGIVLVMGLLVLAGCSGGGDDEEAGESLQPSEVTLATLSGTYDFIDATVTFPDGSTVTPDDFTSFSDKYNERKTA